MSTVEKPRVTIIGAGFSGLSLAWALRRKGIPVTILERNLRSGGMISSERHPELLRETAANGMISSALVEDFFSELGLEIIPMQRSSKARYIWRKFPRRWPLSFVETVQFAFHFFPRLLFKESLKPNQFESVQTWGERCLGSAATRYLLGPALQGIYGTHTAELSASLILGRFFSGKRQRRGRYRGTVSPKNGMGQLISSLTNWLLQNKTEIHFGKSVHLNDLNGCVVIATSSAEAADLLKDQSPTTAHLLAGIERLPVMTVTAGIRNCQNPLKGFGMLVPQEFGFSTLGVLFNNYIFSDRGPFHSETWILSSHQKKELFSLADSEIEELLVKERQALFGSPQKFDFCKITRWPKALPRYSVQLERTLSQMSSALVPGKCYLTGNYLGSIGLAQILEKNLSLADQIERELK